jgi:serine/threonine-protein kinase
MPQLSDSQHIRDTYEVERFLGEGAFAEVYRVKHRFLGRQAMKVFKRGGMTLNEIEEVLGEAILLSKIGHPNIVRVFDANIFETDGETFGYFTMENVPGGSLDKFWNSYGNQFIPIETAVDLVKQVCRGLSVAHQQEPPIIHRDIKPQNILVGYENDGLRARISDFGLAKKVNPLTLLATTAGTPAFKPPEAFSTIKGDSCAADVWGIGATLYLLLSDRLPFQTKEDIVWGGRPSFKEKLRPVSDFNPDVDARLDMLLEKTLEIKQEKRFQNAMEVLDALNTWSPKEQVASDARTALSPEQSKTVLGNVNSSFTKRKVEDVLQEIFALKKSGHLSDAADIMEEAFNKWPELRGKYAPQIKLWRCGISM